LLLNAFLEEFSSTAHRPPPRVTAEAWPLLERHAWPGNVRELRNAAERLVVLDDDGSVSAEDLRGALQHVVPARNEDLRAHEEDVGRVPAGYAQAQDQALREFRAEYLRRLLKLHDGNVSRAAATAGVSRRTLHRWLAELGRVPSRE
jgi:DNA-binding NtrC family response regulator